MRRLPKAPYQFPANKRAEANWVWEQLDKVIEEAEEAARAYHYREGSDRVIEETWDVIAAAEGVLRNYKLRDVLVGKAKVLIKNRRRGDW